MSSNKTIPSSQADSLHSAISMCEKKLEELKTLSQQCMAKSVESRDYARKLCRSLVYQICEELKIAAADSENEAEEEVIYVKERTKTPSDQIEHKALRRSPRRQSASEVAPIPNEIYLAYWPMSKSWLAVLILPLEEIETYGLSESMPACYDRDESTGIAMWREGYEDEGPLIFDRQFPVMFLERVSRIDKNAVGWVTAKNLQRFDPPGSPASLIQDYSAVIAFLQSRQASSTERPLSTDRDTRKPPFCDNSCPKAPASAERHRPSTPQMLRTMPDSVYLSRPSSISATGHSLTFYDLPPLNTNQSKITKSLPTIRPLIDTTSAVKKRAIDYRHYNRQILATYRNVAPRIKPIIEWPSLSKQRHTRPLHWPLRSRNPRSPVVGGFGGARRR